MDWFGKYVGVQGILALAMGIGYIFAPYAKVVLPAGYSDLMFLIFGFYFAKNGVGIVAAMKGN